MISGDLLSKSEAEGAIEAFLRSGKEIEKLEEGFVAVDATMVTCVVRAWCATCVASH